MHTDFLDAFAKYQKLPSVRSLTSEHAERYAFQIDSRKRAEKALDLLTAELDMPIGGSRVLDVGCAYGAFAIEFAKRGAKVVGLEVSRKWLQLAEANALGEPCQVRFMLADASARTTVAELTPHAPFDLVLLNDVLEHIYDTVGLLDNLTKVLTPRGRIYFKVPNGLATRHVLREGHKRVFGVSLLPPDVWPLCGVKPGFSIYYRRWEYFTALFEQFGLSLRRLTKVTDSDRDQTVRHIRQDSRKIKTEVLARNAGNFTSTAHFRMVREACERYFSEVEVDIGALDHRALFEKYRVTFWEGILTLR